MHQQQTNQFLKSFQAWHLKLNELNVRGLLLTTAESLENLSANIKNKLEIKSQSSYLSNEKMPAKSYKVENYLGSESKIIAFDASVVFDPNFFAAISGSLVGGGILILVLRESNLNQAITYSRIISNQLGNSPITNKIPEAQTCPILERLLRFSIDNTSTAMINNNQFYFVQELLKKIQAKTDYTQQQRIISQIKRVSSGHANRPLVITANRGRGKSAALGIASAQLALEKPLVIIVTAPKFNNLDSFYKHLKETLINIDQSNLSANDFNSLKKLELNNGSIIKFTPIDEIIKNIPFANLLIIDEAAAIPVSQLKNITQAYNRMIFSTTTDGYEGNGQGFEIRFKKRLLETKPSSVFTTLDQPIRWSIEDELERSCFKALLLESKIESIDLPKIPIELFKQLQFELIDKLALSMNENNLQHIFSLLVNAHYQTRPTDLKTILTDKNTLVFVVKMDQRIIAVSLIKQEGELSEDICNQISDATTRLKGELLPQTIIVNNGLIAAGYKKYYRVMRIAVHPQLQNMGIGSYLLDQLTTFAKNNDIDYIGSSFSTTPEVVSFWIKNKYHCIRFGTSKDSSSGNHCLEILKPLNDNSLDIFNLLINRFNQSFLYKLHSELFDLELSVISIIILKHLTYNNDLLDQYELEELNKFTQGKRSFSSIDDLLMRLVQERKCYLVLSNGWNETQVEFLIAAIFKQIKMKDLALLFNLNGKKESLSLLRELTKKCLRLD